MVKPIQQQTHSWAVYPIRGTPARFDGLGQRFLVRIISGGLCEPIGPSVDDGAAVDVLDAGHDAFLEFVF